MHIFSTLDWAGLGGIAAIVALLMAMMGTLVAQIRKWRKGLSEEEDLDQRIITTLFGKDAVPPYPAIDGLVSGHNKITKSVEDLNVKVAALEYNISIIDGRIGTLIERTQENGGSSIKDQLNNIEQYIKARQIVDSQTNQDK